MKWLKISGGIYLCPTDPARPCGRYVYQRVRPGLGNVSASADLSLQLRRWVKGTNPRTPAQTARRDKFRAAIAAWHALDTASRHAWRAAGTSRRLPGYHAFLSAFLRAT